MTLETDKIRLRALEPEDLDWLYRLENDDRLWSQGCSNVPYSRYVLKKYISDSRQDIYLDGQLRLAVVAQDSGEAVGCVDLTDFSPRHLRAEVGIVILPGFQRRGYATAALRMLADYARGHLFLHQLYAVVSTENTGGCRLFRQAGYECCAKLPDWLRKNAGVFAHAFLFRILL